MNKVSIEKARGLRKKGKSYTEIQGEVNIPRSTLHYWLKDIPIPDNIIIGTSENWMSKVQRMGALANKAKRETMLVKISEEARKISKSITLDKDQMRLVLSSLYWAEGSKVRGVLIFANTDPLMNIFFVDLLRRCFKIDELKFRLRLHLHDYHNEDLEKKFWSSLLKIPLNQFQKTYFKSRSKNKKYRNNSHGICFVIYNDSRLKEEVTMLSASYAREFTRYSLV